MRMRGGSSGSIQNSGSHRNHVAILRPDPQTCFPAYLSLFLNSPAGVVQSEMFQTGSSGQLELYPSDVMKIVVFVPSVASGKPDMKWQRKLAEKVVASDEAKTLAILKMNEALEVVEREIAKARPAKAK
jgi:type I restriction enzyme, S subunit